MCWQSLTMVFLMLAPHVLMFEFTHHQSSSFLYWFHFPFRPWCGTRIRTSPSWIQMGIVGDASRQCTWVHLARLGQFIADITIAASARRQRAHPVLNWYCSGWQIARSMTVVPSIWLRFRNPDRCHALSPPHMSLSNSSISQCAFNFVQMCAWHTVLVCSNYSGIFWFSVLSSHWDAEGWGLGSCRKSEENVGRANAR